MGTLLTLHKKDGRSLEGIRAVVRFEKISFNETDPPLEVGDVLRRGLADGRVEEYLVCEVARHPRKIGRSGGRGSHYQARVQKKGDGDA